MFQISSESFSWPNIAMYLGYASLLLPMVLFEMMNINLREGLEGIRVAE